MSIRNAVLLPNSCHYYRGSLGNGIHLDGVKCENTDLVEVQSDFPHHINVCIDWILNFFTAHTYPLYTFLFYFFVSIFQYLEIVGGYMWNLTVSSFANYPRLQYLILRSCVIHNIEEDTFSSLTNLVYLDLSENAINVLPPLPLSIETLYLNRMSTSPAFFDSRQTINAITRLKGSLKKLSMRGNGLRSWPPFLKELSCLNEIDVDKNFIEELSIDDIAYLCDLKVLVFSGDRIRSTEKNVCQCRRLKNYGLEKKVFMNVTCPSTPNLSKWLEICYII